MKQKQKHDEFIVNGCILLAIFVLCFLLGGNH